MGKEAKKQNFLNSPFGWLLKRLKEKFLHNLEEFGASTEFL